MKRGTRRTVVRSLGVGLLLAAAYLLGLTARVTQPGGAAAGHREWLTAANNEPTLTRDEAWARLQKVLSLHPDYKPTVNNKNTDPFAASQPGTPFPDDEVADIAGKVSLEDLAYLVGQTCKQPASWEKNDALCDLFGAFANPAGVRMGLGLLEEVDDAEMRNGLRGTLLETLVRVAPDEALAALVKLNPEDDSYNDTYARIYGLLAGLPKYRDATIAQVMTLPEGTLRLTALTAVAHGWAEDQPEQALAWASSLRAADAGVFANTYNWIVSNCGFDPKDVYTDALVHYFDKMSFDSRDRRDRAIGAIAGKLAYTGSYPDLTPRDPVGAFDWINQQTTGNTYDQMVIFLFSNLSPDNPDFAKILNQITEADLRKDIIANAAIKAGTDPASRIAWVESLPPSDAAGANAAMKGIFLDWARTDPAAAAAYIQNSPDPAALLPAASLVAEQLGIKSPSAALAFLAGLPTGDIQTKALADCMMTIGSKTSLADTMTAVENLPEGDFRNRALGELAGELTGHPAQMAQVLEQIPEGSLPAEIASEVTMVWANSNPQTYAAWAGGLPPGALRDAAATQMALTEAATNPAEALAWANSINDPQLRAQQVQTAQLAAQVDAMPPGDARDAVVTQLVAQETKQNFNEAAIWAESINNAGLRHKQISALEKLRQANTAPP